MQCNRREFLRAAGVGVCCFGLTVKSAWGKSQSVKPNIILCMADDQGWGDMAYNGHPVLKTPHFDAMVKEALRFDRFYAAAPVCSPTRGSVMTGRHPNRFGCFKWGRTLRPQEITIAEALKTAGYVTGHFGKWHLGSVCKGSPVNPGASGFDEWFSSPNFFDNDPILSREGKAVPTQGESSMVTVDAALEFIRKHAKTPQPFLAVVWFGSPHNPHQAIEQDRVLYQDQSKKLQHFYGEITGMDRAFGKLRGALRELGIRENTNLGVTGGRGHKGSIYEGGLRVPALLEWPARISKPRITEVPCNTSDIYPTLLDIVGVKMAKQPPLDGISLTPLLEGKIKARPQPMGFWDHPTSGVSTPSKAWMASLLKAQKEGKEIDDPARLFLDAGKITKVYPTDSFPGHSAWLDWPWKLHRIERKNKIVWELYNLADDAQEANNLLDKEATRAARMKTELVAWQKSVVDSLNGKDYEKNSV
jgi:arylsulfatase A-like enzyme